MVRANRSGIAPTNLRILLVNLVLFVFNRSVENEEEGKKADTDILVKILQNQAKMEHSLKQLQEKQECGKNEQQSNTKEKSCGFNYCYELIYGNEV